MATSNSDRVGLLDGNNTGAGASANKVAGRVAQLNKAEDDAMTGKAVPAASTPATGGVKFFNGRPATTAQSEAKKKALIARLRAKPAEPAEEAAEEDK